MSVAAVILLLVSVFVHAGWNTISRLRRPDTAFMLLATTTGTVLLAPMAVWHADQLYDVAPRFWVLLGGTSLFMALYYIALAGAYRTGEMSLIYPLARALPALLVPLISVCLDRADGLTWWLSLSGGLVVAGAMLLPMRHFSDLRAGHYSSRAFRLATLAAVGTTGYTILDYHCMHLLQRPAGPLGPVAAPLSYIVLQGLCTGVWLLLYVLAGRREREALKNALRSPMKSPILTGLGIYLAYSLVLAAYTHVSDPSYVAVFRQLSIPVGVVFGLTLLGERRTWPKLVGATMIFAGALTASL